MDTFFRVPVQPAPSPLVPPSVCLWFFTWSLQELFKLTVSNVNSMIKNPAIRCTQKKGQGFSMFQATSLNVKISTLYYVLSISLLAHASAMIQSPFSSFTNGVTTTLWISVSNQTTMTGTITMKSEFYILMKKSHKPYSLCIRES